MSNEVGTFTNAELRLVGHGCPPYNPGAIDLARYCLLLKRALREVRDSGRELDDERMRYILVQIPRVVMEEIVDLLPDEPGEGDKNAD